MLKEVDEAYFRLKVKKIHSGDRTDIAQLKAAHETLHQWLITATASEILQASDQEPLFTELDRLTAAIADKQLTAKASLKAQRLHLGTEKTITPTHQ